MWKATSCARPATCATTICRLTKQTTYNGLRVNNKLQILLLPGSAVREDSRAFLSTDYTDFTDFFVLFVYSVVFLTADNADRRKIIFDSCCL